ncbi:MAG: hypothetical protein QOE14_807, partial [Humisphaera sp.]|nr:hypothetical protein [Humisphaera sp.]
LLLMVAGRSMFPFMSPGTTPQTIRANVSESGRLPSASSGKKGPDYFIIGTGRAEVYDTHAIFRPDGSPAVVSVTAPIDAAANAGVAPPPSNDPNAAPPDPSTQPAPPMPIPPPPTFTPMPNPLASINSTAATLSIVAGILGLLLAIYLLVIGIMTLRDARSGGRLHWWYVGLKIPLVALAITAYSWLIWSFLNGMAATANAAAANSGAVSPPPVPSAAGMGAAAIFWMVLLGSAALAYPLSLVAVLLTKTVREYYRPARN